MAVVPAPRNRSPSDSRRQATAPVSGFRVHGEKIRDRAQRPTGPRLDGLEPNAPGRGHAAARVLGDEPDEAFRSQPLPDPSTVDGVGGVESVPIALPEGLPHPAPVEHEDVEVAKRCRTNHESGHRGRNASGD